MRISRWVGNPDSGMSLPGQIVGVTRKEAIRLIASLARQMKLGLGSNDDREEFTANTGTGAEYFSVSIISDAEDARGDEDDAR